MSHDDNDDNGDITQGRQLAAILMHVGATRKGIKRLEDDVREIKDNVDALKERTVDKAQCAAAHLRVDQTLRDLEKESRKRPTTGTGHAAVSTAHMAAQLTRGNTGSMPVTPEEVIEEHREKTRKQLGFWVGLVAAVLPMALGLGYGLVKLGRYMDRMDAAVEMATERTARLSKEVLKKPQVIYVKVPVAPDAGMPMRGRGRTGAQGLRRAHRP